MVMKRIIALILAMVTVFTVVGCSNKKNNDGKVTLRIGVPNGNELTPYSLIEEFKKANPDIEVVLEEAPWGDFKTKLKMQIGGGNAPDVFIMDSGYTAALGGLGAALDLTEKIESDLNADEYIGALFAAKDGEGKVWGVPHGINSLALYYNEQIFDDAGIEYPDETWTYQEMIDTARKLTSEKNADGISEIYGFTGGYGITTGWLPFMLSTGGAPLNGDRTESNFSDPRTVEGMEKFATLTVEGIAPPMAWITQQGSIEAAFYKGKLAMAFMNSAAANLVNINAPEGFRYNVTSVPIGWDGEKNAIYVPNCWIINAKSDETVQDAAWEWIKFYLSEESQLKLAETCPGGYPIKKSAVEYCATVDTAPKNRTAFIKDIDQYGVTLFENPTWEEWCPVVTEMAKDLYNGAIKADEAAVKIDAKLKDILAE